MGHNLAQLFTSLADMPDEEVQKLHPRHTQASVKALLPRLHYFEEGICIVHHIFGGEVTELVRKAYGDAYLTAHFEVSLATCHVLPGLVLSCLLALTLIFLPVSAEIAFIPACFLEHSLLDYCMQGCLSGCCVAIRFSLVAALHCPVDTRCFAQQATEQVATQHCDTS